MLKLSHLTIIGGGFSGTLLAINLLRYGSMRVTLVERRPDRLGKGLAFGSARPDHILNVRAGNMSAFPDQPTHFAQWLARDTGGTDASFATRATYGRYLASLLDAARAEAGDRFEVIDDQAIDLVTMAQQCRVALSSGRTLTTDLVALAPGNLPPHDLPPFRDLAPPLYAADPWGSDISHDLAPSDRVLLLGTGLTAVDCIQTLHGAGFQGSVLAMSRRGLLPHSHAPSSPSQPLRDKPASHCAALIRTIRDRAATAGWRNAVDELRPFTQDIWRAATATERARFLRHARPYWDVHRHRIAPLVAERLAAMQAEGRLKVAAGKIIQARRHAHGLVVCWRPRGESQTREVPVARVINCTGPLADLRRTTDPLLRSLSDRGMIRPDALAIGIDTDRQGRAIAQDDHPQDRLLVVGPMTRGAHWEIVAVPDIRRQTWDLARALTGAQWSMADGL
ncbi:FAD/NAD(P)-binding protein [Sphingobium sp. AP49]|uniref:FAD/NAD(P)-binding protein n=1 Tax=Sphingobium sp. AP49 TaxID=1144307 RepID=UPI00026EE118|nr:FAD/NAD(P)-binding protein [Sphingobium sp. AP49]WHO37669.1 FAD/NAD(P)-binding protein [Sphingobium sp. AP49]